MTDESMDDVSQAPGAVVEAGEGLDGSRPVVEASPHQSSWKPLAALALLTVVATCGWWLLYRWYGLDQNRDNTHFGFDKIQGGLDSPIMRQTALIFLGLGAAYAASIWLLRSLSPLSWLPRILAVLLMLGPGVANVALYPAGALDVFNYMIELKLTFHYGENPYLVTFEGFRADSFAKPAFLVDILLFYGPAWLVASWVPVAVTGFDDVIRTLVGLKVFNFVLLAVAAVLIAAYQRDHRVRWMAATVFLANPLILFEGVANAHNDVLLATLMIGAMLALQRKSPLAGPLLALSALVKVYTVVLVPLFVVMALRDRWGWRRAALATVLATVAVVAVSAGFWGDGKLVDGLRIGLSQSQEVDHVSPLSLVQQFFQEREASGKINADFLRGRPSAEIVPEATQDVLRYGGAALFGAAALLIAASVWKGRAPELAAAETLLLMVLLTTNLYGWYLIPVFALLALRLDRPNLWYIAVATTLGLVYYPMYVYAHFNTDWTRFQVHQFLSLFLTVPILLYLGTRSVIGLANLRRNRAPVLGNEQGSA